MSIESDTESAAIPGRSVPERELLNAEDTASYLGRSLRTVLAMFRDGTIPGKKIGKSWFADRAALRGLVAGGRQSVEPLSKTPPPVSAVHLPNALQVIEEKIAYLKETLGGSGQLLNNALALGLEAIYPPRRNSGEADQAIERLLLSSKKEILLSGTSLRGFFHDKKSKEVLWKKLNENPAVPVRALMLNPMGRSAQARICAEIEAHDVHDEPDPRRTGLFKDLSTSIDTIARLRKTLKDARALDARFFDYNPFAFFVMTEQWVLVEQYHFGRPASLVGGCIGEQVPLFLFSATSETYQTLKGSFEYVWGKKNHFVHVEDLDTVADAVERLERTPAQNRRKAKTRRGRK